MEDYSLSTMTGLKVGEGPEFGEVAWSDAVELIGKVFLCNRLTESQYRILHRLRHTSLSLNTFYPGISTLCIKCKKVVGTYIHCIWQCPLIFNFWGVVSLVAMR